MGGQGGCERRIEVFVKIQKKNFFLFLGGVGVVLGGVKVDVNEELKFFVKIRKKMGGGGVGGSGWGDQGGCERRIEVFGKIQKKKHLGGGGWGGEGGGVGLGGQGGCERRIEVFVKIQKKKIFFWGGGVGGRGMGSGWGVRVDVNEELKFL